MSDNYLDCDISNVRKGDAKLRVKKNGFGDYLITTVLDGVEGYTYPVKSKDMPDIIRYNTEGDVEATIKKIRELPVSA